MPPRRAQHQRDSQPPPSQQQKPAAASIYRVVIEAPRGTAPFGSIINDASLLLALNECGPVFHLEVKSSICFATFKSTATVEALVAKKTLNINGIVCSTNYLVYNTTSVRCLCRTSGLWQQAEAHSACRAAPLCMMASQAWCHNRARSQPSCRWSAAPHCSGGRR